ncbi:MAG: FliM/FliN family flagellar motor C-terminal domain-containing protein [Pirellulales bacterium]|nr:FliM/FliN family flagellar motor C-terminal domain-containing protein [Pirellulales bacterium]
MDQENLDDYTRTVLSIETPVSVTLATKRVPLQTIVDLVPGSMLTFDSHCDEPLTLEAGGQPIATGETVKIGDKFGLRIREIFDQHGNIA